MRLKAIISAALAVVITAALSISVFAASGINEYEQSILDALSAPITNAAGVERSIPAERINEARNYFNRDDVNVSEGEAVEILAKVNAARELAASTNVTSAEDIPQDVANQIIALAEQAAGVLGLNVSFSFISGNPTTGFTWSVASATGDNVANSDGAIKQAGIGFGSTLAVGAIVLSALLGCVVYTRKSRASSAC